MAWSSEDDSTAGPTGPTADPTPTAAPKTATSPRPKAASSSGVFMATRSAGATASAAGHLVPGLFDGSTDGALVDRRLAGHGQPAAGEVDVAAGDAGDLGDLLGHGADAVAAGHADDGVGGGAHDRSLREIRVDQERTSRAMASEASRTFSSASRPPEAAASTRQWLMCSSSRPSATDWSAFVIADTWVRMSMQYFSSSTMRCRPRAWPSMRRSRLR